jgi:hypothetical protein
MSNSCSDKAKIIADLKSALGELEALRHWLNMLLKEMEK